MIQIDIDPKLIREIENKFGLTQSLKIIKLFKSLKENSNKGKIVGNINNILIKELKYNSFRFYFITDGYKLRLVLKGEILDLVFRFIKMSKKNTQQKTIDEIKDLLRNLEL